MPAQSSGGGGSGAGDIRAGGAYYELALRDQVSGNLSKIQNGVQNFAKTFKQHTAPLQGALGQIFEAGARGGAVGFGIAGAQKLFEGIGKDILDWATGADAFRQRLQDITTIATDLSARAADTLSSIREWAAVETDPTAKIELLTKAIESQMKAWTDLKNRREEAAAALRDIPEGLIFIGGLEPRLEAAKEAITKIDAEMKKVGATFSKLTEERGRLTGERGDPALRAEQNRIREMINKSMNPPTSGLTGEVFRFMDRFGGDGGLLDDAILAEETLRLREARKALDDYVASVEKASREAGKTAHEIALMNAEAAGVDEGRLAEARRTLLSGGGVGQLLGMTLGMLPDIADAIKNLPKISTRGGFVPGGVASQVFGGGSGRVEKALGEIRDGKGGLPERIGLAVARQLRMR